MLRLARFSAVSPVRGKDGEPPRWGTAETLALLLWCAVTGFAVHQHVPWADEAQAWMLADGVSWHTLFLHSLHYEGTGGLWHAFLKLLQALHVSFNGMRWIVAGVEAAAMAVLLGYAPFPRVLRLLLPFTFFLLFQDGVVARSYCLFAILAFPAAALLRCTRPRPFGLALLLGLLANLSVHGVILSAGLAAVAGVLWGRRFLYSVPAMALLLALWVAAALTMAPARDVDFSAGNNLYRSLAKVEESLGIHGSPPPPPVTSLTMGGLEPAPVPVHVRHGAAKVWNRAARILGIITFPLSRIRVLALLLVAGIAAQAFGVRRQRPDKQFAGATGPIGLLPYGLMVVAVTAQAFAGRRALGLVPWALMAAVFSSLYLAPRHAGTLLTAFVVSAWLTWPRRTELIGETSVPGVQGWVRRATALLFLLVCVEQIGWTAFALAQDYRRPYAPAAMTAEYLKSRSVGAPGSGTLVAGYYYFSSAPLLYFDRNIYFNQPLHRYWYWNTAMRNHSMVRDDLARHPQFVVVSTVEPGPDAEVTRDWAAASLPEPGVMLGDGFGVARYFEQHGYRPTHIFCGRSSMRGTYAERMCDTVLEPVKAQPRSISPVAVEW